MIDEDRRLRILLVSQFFDPEPASIPGVFASWLAKRGHQVEVLTGFPNYPGGDYYEGFPVRVLRKEEYKGAKLSRVILYPSHNRSPLDRALNYLSFAGSATLLGSGAVRACDVTYVYHPPATTAIPAVVWKRIRRQPFLYHIQDLWPESVVQSGMIGSSPVLAKVEKALAWWCQLVYREAAVLAVISPGMKELLIDRGVPAEKIQVVENWAEEEIFYPKAYDADLAKAYDLEGYFNIVFSGNLGIYQGLETAVRAAARVRHLPRLRLVFIGSGQMESELKALTKSLNLENVRFLGRLPYKDMGAITNLASILLVSLRDLPFFSSTIPGKTQVALACGRPTIMAVAGDAAAIVKSAGAGIICDPENEDALTAAFEQAYSLTATELAAMGARGRAYYERELSLDRGARRLERMLIDAASSRTRVRA